MISGFRLINFLFVGCLVRNQPEDALNMFLNFVSEIVVGIIDINKTAIM